MARCTDRAVAAETVLPLVPALRARGLSPEPIAEVLRLSGDSRSTAEVPAFALPPAAPWRVLERAGYRGALEAGTLRPGLVRDRPFDAAKPTVVFIHGAGGAPSQFKALADALGERANLTAFLYDDASRLTPSAHLLEQELRRLPASVTVVAHSMGTLLPGYVGAKSCDDRLRRIAAVYLNPLIGGSHYADDIPALRFLRPLKPLVQRLFFRPSVLDITPESAFEQTIFGPSSPTPCFAAHTTVLLTERAGEEPDIVRERIPLFFGRTREQLLGRMGQDRHARGDGTQCTPHASESDRAAH